MQLPVTVQTAEAGAVHSRPPCSPGCPHEMAAQVHPKPILPNAIVRGVATHATILRLYCSLCEEEMECIYSSSPENRYHEHLCRSCGDIAVMDVAYPVLRLDAGSEEVTV